MASNIGITAKFMNNLFIICELSYSFEAMTPLIRPHGIYRVVFSAFVKTLCSWFWLHENCNFTLSIIISRYIMPTRPTHLRRLFSRPIDTEWQHILNWTYMTSGDIHNITTDRPLIRAAPNPQTYKCLLPRLAVVFSQCIETKNENKDIVGAAPVGAAPTTFEWSTIYFLLRCVLY